MLERLHHVSYSSLDAAETVDFYTNVIGRKFAHAIPHDRVPSTQEFSTSSSSLVTAATWRSSSLPLPLRRMAKTETVGDQDRFADAALAVLAEWDARKR